MSIFDHRDEAAASWAIKLSEGDLSRTEQTAFQRWLDDDPRNVEALSEIVGAWQAVDHYATAAPMMDLRNEALAHARGRRDEPSGVTIPAPPLWLLVAACVCLIFAGITIWRTQQPQVYSTGLGERRVVMLDDDSKLSLDANTRVRVKYSRGGRQLWLEQGRAKFEVAKDPLRPFSVAAAGKIVVATGTEFSVELLGRETRVILYEGHVAVLNGSAATRDTLKLFDENPAPRSDYLMLDPGNELIVHHTATPRIDDRATMAIEHPASLESSTDWESGQLVFDNETLAIVAQRTNRYAVKPLELADPRVAQMRISGVFRAGDTEGLVEGLTATLGLQSHDNGRAIVLSPAAKTDSR
ncbi:MAG TPA: FecR domain-containing protein [Sphingomonas sp.]|nr:FecR domain-containing protein [Sphingomonas sp.]